MLCLAMYEVLICIVASCCAEDLLTVVHHTIVINLVAFLSCLIYLLNKHIFLICLHDQASYNICIFLVLFTSFSICYFDHEYSGIRFLSCLLEI